jgi:hypothetical protein
MRPEDRQTLRELAGAHLSALAAQAESIDHALAPALKAMGPTAPPGGSAAVQSWQEAAEELFRSARRVEVLLTELLGASRRDGAGSPGELASSMTSLRNAIEACRTALGNEP